MQAPLGGATFPTILVKRQSGHHRIPYVTISIMMRPHQPASDKRLPSATFDTRQPSKKQKVDMIMPGRQQRGALIDRGEDAKGKSLEGPHYRVTDQDWKMCKSHL